MNAQVDACETLNKPHMNEVLEKFIDQEDLHRNEGAKGVQNLCQLVRAMGYKDPMYFGQFTPTASLGDLICFLEDNPGAITAIHDFISTEMTDEWEQSLRDELHVEVGLGEDEEDDFFEVQY